MKSSFCIDLQRFMLIPTKFPLSPNIVSDGKASELGIRNFELGNNHLSVTKNAFYNQLSGDM